MSNNFQSHSHLKQIKHTKTNQRKRPTLSTKRPITKKTTVSQPQSHDYQSEQNNISEDIHYLLEQHHLGKLSAHLIKVDYSYGFIYNGDQNATRLMLAIFLKHALHQFKQANKAGRIFITMKSSAKFHMLDFTVYSNITTESVCHIFGQLGASIHQDLGFCRHAMQQIDGDLSVSTISGKYMQFVLMFRR